MFKKLIILFILSIFFSLLAVRAQDSIIISKDYLLFGVIIEGDTILVSNIDEVIVFPRPKFKSKREWRKYYKLVRYVKKVYPIARAAGEKYDSVATQLLELKTAKERRIYLNQVEKDIMNEYEDDIRSLTMTQGVILLKLIDREIGETSYDLLKELKGSFTAFFWQAIARIFGQNLKIDYDPDGKDWLIEEIVILIEKGQL